MSDPRPALPSWMINQKRLEREHREQAARQMRDDAIGRQGAVSSRSVYQRTFWREDA